MAQASPGRTRVRCRERGGRPPGGQGFQRSAQATEKALKAVLLRLRINIPFTHDIRELMNRLEAGGAAIAGEIADADELTRYAVAARYPSAATEPVTPEELDRALHLARHVDRWAESLVRSG